MRATHNEQVGTSGASYVRGKFEDLGWGPAENPYHDLGTDMWIMVRDERRWDLGLLVGAQAKSGASYFSMPHRDAGGSVDGWWYAEDDRAHFDSWISHAVPHLIVLFDPATQNAYWVHVTSGAVVSTGMGAKILVPAANLLDRDHRRELLEVAASQRPSAAWEGSAWRGFPDLLPKDRLRHALLVPRLVAPHRNRGPEAPLKADEAIALLVQIRLQDIEHYAERFPGTTGLADALDSPEWLWRFAGALARRLEHGDLAPLEERVADAPDTPARCAAVVVLAGECLAAGRADEAVQLLEVAIAPDDAEPVDQAWMNAQLARAYGEVGRAEEAIKCGLLAQDARRVHPDDVTAAALAAVGSSLVFRLSGGPADQLEAMITAVDTPGAVVARADRR